MKQLDMKFFIREPREGVFEDDFLLQKETPQL